MSRESKIGILFRLTLIWGVITALSMGGRVDSLVIDSSSTARSVGHVPKGEIGWKIVDVVHDGKYDYYENGFERTRKQILELRPGDRIVVYHKSRLLLRTLDGRVLILGPDTILRIAKRPRRVNGSLYYPWIVEKGMLLVESSLYRATPKKFILIRLGRLEFRIGGNFFLTRWQGKWGIGSIQGKTTIWIGGFKYAIELGKFWLWMDGRWKVIDIPTNLWKVILSMLENVTTGEKEETSFESCMQNVPIFPGASNAPVFPVKPGVNIQNDDVLRNYLVRAPLREVIDYYRTHPPRGKGWILHENSNLLEWKRGDSSVVIGISPTGVEGITGIYFHECSINEPLPGHVVEQTAPVPPSVGSINPAYELSSAVLTSSTANAACFIPVPENHGWERDREAERSIHRSNKKLWDYKVYRTPVSVKLAIRRYRKFLHRSRRWNNPIWKERGYGCLWMGWDGRFNQATYTAVFCEKEDGMTEVDLFCRKRPR